MEINAGILIPNETNINAMGGSEIIATRIAESCDQELLKGFQIVNSRVRNIDETKVRVYLAHDTSDDPESEFLANGGHRIFHRLVFVSNHQMQKFITKYNIPWNKCLVIQNAVIPIENHEKINDGTIRLAYWSTPHRGLNILYPVFDHLSKKYNGDINIELDVFSSFKIYGWEDRDTQFNDLFDACKEHPKVNYHGSVSNDEIREYLKTAHILAYPNIWEETSCMVLMEAMSAGLMCVHPNYGALYETAANWTNMYQFHDNLNEHANLFYHCLDESIENYWSEYTQHRLKSQKGYANVFYSWNSRIHTWNAFLHSIKDLDPKIEKEMLNIKIG